MKIGLNENDIRLMVKNVLNEVLSKTKLSEDGEFSGFRNVRKIIIDNILSKHPGFHGDSNLAWGYYVMKHQGQREKEESTIPEELKNKVLNALQEEKILKANIESEKQAKLNAYKEWASNPENYKEVAFDFKPMEIDFNNEEEIQNELKRLSSYSKDWMERGKNFKKDVTLQRDSDGQSFNTSFSAPMDQTKKNEIYNKLMDALYVVQSNFGLKNFKECVYYCPNSENEPTDEWKRREQMMSSDEKNGNIVAASNLSDHYQEMRGFHKTYWPKYRMIYEVDSSD